MLLQYDILTHVVVSLLVHLFFSLQSAKMRMIEKNEDVCLLDITTTYTILNEKYYFSNLTLCKTNVHTISGPVEIIEGFGSATVILSNGITMHI